MTVLLFSAVGTVTVAGQLDLVGYGGGIFDTKAFKPVSDGDIKVELGGGAGVKCLQGDAIVMADGCKIAAGMDYSPDFPSN